MPIKMMRVPTLCTAFFSAILQAAAFNKKGLCFHDTEVVSGFNTYTPLSVQNLHWEQNSSGRLP